MDLRLAPNEGIYAGYYKPSQVPMFGEVMDSRGQPTTVTF